ncbi:MAG: tRNA lysidine(34) synthetase TilS [Acidimicrobiales bacterium]
MNHTRIHIDGLLEHCAFPPPGTSLDCAVSGGADSLALLVLGVAAGCRVCAHHVDHGLRPGSGAEADVVAAAAERFGTGFAAHQVEVDRGPNLEARARAARYGVLPEGVSTGHTADDQAETLLLALLWGSAWPGLSAMEPGPRRPILRLRRADTESLCERLGLDPVVDPSNTDPVHRRNRVRHELLPLLDEIGQRDTVPVLARQADLFRQGGEVLAELAAALDPTDAKALSAAPEVLARQAVRDWLRSGRDDEHPPDLATVDRVLAVARVESRGTDVGRGWRVERSAQRLRLVAPTDQQTDD